MVTKEQVMEIIEDMACYCSESIYTHSAKHHQGSNKAIISYDNVKERLSHLFEKERRK